LNIKIRGARNLDGDVGDNVAISKCHRGIWKRISRNHAVEDRVWRRKRPRGQPRHTAEDSTVTAATWVWSWVRTRGKVRSGSANTLRDESNQTRTRYDDCR
jgi:hypothetical protein